MKHKIQTAVITALFKNTPDANSDFKSQYTFATFAAVDDLSGPVRKETFTSKGPKGHGL